MSNAQGAQSQMAVKDGTGALDFTTGSTLIVFEPPETFSKNRTLLNHEGIRGTRSHHHNRASQDTYEAGGTFDMFPGEEELKPWLTRAMGSLTAGAYTLEETLPEFGVLVDKVADIWAFNDCKVNRFILSGTSGDNVRMQVEVFAKSAVDYGSAFPSLTYAASSGNQPLIFSQVALTLGGGPRFIENFTLTIDNQLQRYFRNSETARSIGERDRIVTLSLQHEWTAADRAALFDLGRDGLTDGVLTLGTPSGSDFTLTFGALAAATELPTVQGKDDIPMVINWRAYEDNTGKEISATWV